jgi:hypothetical protein
MQETAVSLFFNLLPFIFLCLVVGAAVLWKKTKRAAVLLQLIASSLIFVLLAVESLAHYLVSIGKSQLLDVIYGPHVQPVGQIAFLVAFVVFTVGYLWYALFHLTNR